MSNNKQVEKIYYTSDEITDKVHELLRLEERKFYPKTISVWVKKFGLNNYAPKRRYTQEVFDYILKYVCLRYIYLYTRKGAILAIERQKEIDQLLAALSKWTNNNVGLFDPIRDVVHDLGIKLYIVKAKL